MKEYFTIMLVFHEGREPKRIRIKKSVCKGFFLVLGLILFSLVSLYIYNLSHVAKLHLLKMQVMSLEAKLKEKEEALSMTDQAKNGLLKKMALLEAKIKELETYLSKRGFLRPQGLGGPSFPVPPKRENQLEDLVSYLEQLDRRIKGTPLGYPIGAEISSLFGVRKNPFGKGYEFHSGIDFEAPFGAEVMATAEGVVEYAGWLKDYGLTVIIKHPTGYTTLYSHFSEIKVKTGDKVKAGEVIGKVGSTGRSTSPHLHYEVQKDGRYLNPLKFLSAS